MSVRSQLAHRILAQPARVRAKAKTEHRTKKEVGAILEPEKLPVQTPMKKRSYHKWTNEKRSYLIGLLGQYTEYTVADYAEALNRRFKEEVRTSANSVKMKLVHDVYRKRPDLRKRYEWTEEKRSYLVGLLEQYPEYTHKQYAEALNKKFKDRKKASAMIVADKLTRDIYRKRPELRKRELYEWTNKKRSYLIGLLEQYPEYTHKQYAEALNRRFKEGKRASAHVVMSKITMDIYRKRPELKKKKADLKLTEEERLKLVERLETLTPIARSVAKERLFSDDKKTLKEIGEMHGVSRERARQVQEKLLDEIREAGENQPG